MFEEMVKDEEEHEQSFANQTQGAWLKDISFIILGLADAIVEISGIHAGSLASLFVNRDNWASRYQLKKQLAKPM